MMIIYRYIAKLYRKTACLLLMNIFVILFMPSSCSYIYIYIYKVEHPVINPAIVINLISYKSLIKKCCMVPVPAVLQEALDCVLSQ